MIPRGPVRSPDWPFLEDYCLLSVEEAGQMGVQLEKANCAQHSGPSVPVVARMDCQMLANTSSRKGL